MRKLEYIIHMTIKQNIPPDEHSVSESKRNRMLSIFSYTDYRCFLKDYFENMKTVNKYFSYKVFSEKAGIKSRGFLHNVIKGKRNLSSTNIPGLIKAIRLNKKEASYFEYLVGFNQAKQIEEKNYFFEKISSIKSNSSASHREPHILNNDQYEFYSELRHSVIRSLIDLYDFRDDYEWLAKKVYPPITSAQAKSSVELLKKLGLIIQNEDKSYSLRCKNITTPKEILSLAVMNFHLKTANAAVGALNRVPKSKRDFSSITLGITESMYKTICSEIDMFKKKLMILAEQDPMADKVYQMNIQFFPVSSDNNKGGQI
ncbi:hypothetical protein CHISP_1200 [Chitinispirillum alkaliphilum]|nr:hypothetical protein CHISP_1200 [Chitinispirillum alkaliphilum]